MDRNYLIENCYNNKYNIDLLGIHINSSQYSKYDKPTSIFDAKFDRNNVNFYDGISTHFELVYRYDMIYLLGDKSCYPCGKIVEGAYDINWVPIHVVPTGSPIKVFQDIYNTCCIYEPRYIDQCLKSLPVEHFENYIQDYIGSFEINEWFNRNHPRFLICFYFTSVPIEKIFKELRYRKLLNPFEIALGSIIFDFSITSEEVLNYLNYGKGIPFQHHGYLEYFRTRFSLSDSTNLLISSENLQILVESMNVNDIDKFFEIDYLIDILNFDNSYRELMADVLDVSVYTRYFDSSESKLYYQGDIVKQKLQQKLSTVNITESSVTEFYRRIKSNIRSIENQVRKNSGYREVGTVYNEILIFNYFKENFKDQDVLYQYKPAWLGRQIFDVYFKSLNVAIEYNGKQHYQPIGFYGGDKGFENLVRLDLLKRKKCLENQCILFEIKYDEDIPQSLSNIKNEIEFYISKGERIK
jgi:hypothetical protein